MASEEDGKMYHIHAIDRDPASGESKASQITDKPLSLKDIQAKHGSVQNLESKGFRIKEAETATPIKPIK
jgi:hypothetical protein